MEGQLRMSMTILENSQKLELSHNLYLTPYSLNWEFVNSQNKVSDVFDLNMRRICGGKEWIF